jgi:erythrocyte band 7 integral membrane protein
MATEAEAFRESNAHFITAKSEKKTSEALLEAAKVIDSANTSTAMQLRYLQTLSSLSSERNTTILFPFPVDLMTLFKK